MTKDQRRDLATFIRTNPQMTYFDFAHMTNLGYSTITLIAQEFGIRRVTGPKTTHSKAGVE